MSNSLHRIGNTIQQSMHMPDSDMHIPQLDIGKAKVRQYLLRSAATRRLKVEVQPAAAAFCTVRQTANWYGCGNRNG